MLINDLSFIIPAVLTAFIICFLLVPVFYRLSGLRDLIYNSTGEKKGGAGGVFLAVLLTFSFWGFIPEVLPFPYFMAALFLLFLTGVKNEIFTLNRFEKIVVQFTASLLLVAGGNVVLTNMGGFIGLGDLSWFAGVAFSVALLMIIMNSFYLIGRVNGLAGGIAVIISGFLGIWFWGADFMSLAILSFSLSGALLGFLIFNMSPAGIDMGETGAIATGFLIGFLGLEFLTLNAALSGEVWQVSNAGVLAFAILIIPFKEFVKAMAVRFSAFFTSGLNDHEHGRRDIHHELLESGMTHNLASFSLWIVTIFMTGLAFLIAPLEAHIQLLIILLFGSCILPVIRVLYGSFGFLLHYYDKVRERRSGSSASTYQIN